ncbi:MAG TPA: RDD family protein, partial [Gammaproteobacteria bacterium]|nr:RDD family protein [Gammaproteobacteria bacterium]
MDQPGRPEDTPPQSGNQTPPPPPEQGWQSTPQQPAPPPPPASAPPGGGMPSWTSNITAQGTVPGPGGVALADTPNRIIAAVIDFIILGVIGFIVSTLTTSMLGDDFFGGLLITTFKVPSLISSVVAVALMLVVSGAYFIGMWTQMGGATVGMKALKLSVRDSTSGGAITQQQAINRWLLLGAPVALTWFQVFLGFILGIVVLVYYIYLLV